MTLARPAAARTVAAVAALAVSTGLFLAIHGRGGSGAHPSHAIPASIPADCSRPVETDIKAFLATVPDGATAVFAKNGCYAQDGSIEVNDRSGLTLEGNGSTFKAVTPGDPCRANWRIQSGSNITLKDMTVRGINTTGFDGPRQPAPAAQCQHGYSFDSVQGGKLLNSKAYDTLSDPVSIEPDRRKGDFCAVPPNRAIFIDHFYGFNGGRTLGITDADGVTVQNSYLGDMYDNAIDLETDVPCESTANIRILNNHFGRYRFALVAHTGPDSGERSSHIEIRGNVAQAAPLTCFAPIYVQPSSKQPPGQFRSHYSIRDNQLRTLGNGIYLNTVSDASVTDNSISKSYGTGCITQAYAVDLRNAQRVSVFGNRTLGDPKEWAGEMTADKLSSDINRERPK